jgi:predicted PurR-regulated permease PerM
VPACDRQEERSEWSDRLETGNQGFGERQEMPLPQDPRAIFQGILCIIAVLVCLYIARDIAIPLVLALVLKLLFQPLVRLLEGVHIPKPVGALVALVALLSVFVGLGILLANPAAQWAADLSKAWPQVQQKFAALRDPIEHIQHLFDQVGIQFGNPSSLLSHPIGIVTAVFSGTGTVAAHLVETLLVLFYLLVFGETFLRRLVEVLPTFGNKREVVEISLHIERDLSAYLLTVAVINAAVGCATSRSGCVSWGLSNTHRRSARMGLTAASCLI